MRPGFIVLLTLIGAIPLQAALKPAAQVDWVRAVASEREESLWGLTTDPDGHLLLHASFPDGSLSLGGGTIASVGLDSLIKLDRQGNAIGEQHTGLAPYQLDVVRSDRFGNTILSGPSVVLNAITARRTNQLARIDAAGNVVRSGTFEELVGVTARGVTADSAGNLYVCGTLVRPFDFGPFSDRTINLDDEFGFVAKLGTNGVWEWLRPLESNGSFLASSRIDNVGIDANGDVIVTGAVYGSWRLGTFLLDDGSTVGSQSGSFVAKISAADGAPVWVRYFDNTTLVTQLQMGPDGSTWVAGKYHPSMTDLAAVLSGTSERPHSFYVGRLNSEGQFEFARSGYVRYGNVRVTALTMDASGVLYLGGRFYFGDLWLGDRVIPKAFEYVGYVAALTQEGEWLWVEGLPGSDVVGSAGEYSPVLLSGGGHKLCLLRARIS